MTLSRRLRDLLSHGHARDVALLEGDGLQHERPETPVDAAVLVGEALRPRGNDGGLEAVEPAEIGQPPHCQ